MKSLELAIVMPVYNEEAIISKVVKDWLLRIKNINGVLIIINDGSKDNTLKSIKKFKDRKIKLINQKNAGHGPSILKGYSYALKSKAKYIFQVDTDDQFFSRDFSKFWKKKKDYDFFLGFRKKRYDNSARLVITRVLRAILFIIFKVKILDANIPYRLMKREFLKYAFKNYNLNVNITNVFLSIIAAKKFKTFTLSVKHKERKTGKVSLANIKLFKYCFISFLNIIKLRLSF